MREHDVTRLGDLLPRVGKKLRVEDPVATGKVWHLWTEIVGDEIACHAEPTSLKDGVLRVRTATPVWATEMTYLAEDVKARVNAALGKPVVREIKVWTSPEPIGRRARAERSGPTPRESSRKTSSSDEGGWEVALRRAFEAWSKRRSRTR